MAKTQAILFVTHQQNAFVWRQLCKLQAEAEPMADVVVLYQQTADGAAWVLPQGVRGCAFSVQSLNALGYNPFAEAIIPGSNHFAVLQFYKENPQYEYYWNVEYDVSFSGNWADFFAFFASKGEDFISTHLQTMAENPVWNRWGEMELNHLTLPREKYVKSFNPIYRISKAALKFLDTFLRQQHRGHHELLMPTALNCNGYTLADMGGRGSFAYPGTSDLFYTDGGNPQESWYIESTMRFRPIFHPADMRLAGKLYHPVKSNDGVDAFDYNNPK